MQRLFDVAISAIALLMLAPLFIPIFFVLKFTGEGEIFFLQERVGRFGAPFRLIKFATMLKDSPHIGTGTVTLKDDPRVLPVGRFLRKTKINELPQIINVLKGDMSVIGPRPQTRRCFDAFPDDAKKAIIKVRPGLSGVGSIVFRDEEALMHASEEPERLYDEVIMPYKGELERWYVTHRGVRTYFLCIVVTAWVVFRPSATIIFKLFPDLPSPPPSLGPLRGLD